MMMFSCQQCKTEFQRSPSRAGKFCSYGCKNLSQTKLSINICKNCGKHFQHKPARLNQFFCSVECFHANGRENRTCITCLKSFQVEKTSRNVRCSRKCQYVDQSNGKIKMHCNGRTGYRTDIGLGLYFKSSLEADFARLLLYWQQPFEYESKTFATDKGAYTPDFYLPLADLFVELKGPEDEGTKFTNMMRRNVGLHHQLDVNIVTFTQNWFHSFLKEAKLWDTIPNLEQRNYKKTAHLIVKHENQATTQN